MYELLGFYFTEADQKELYVMKNFYNIASPKSHHFIPQSEIKKVNQRGEQDCGIACLSIITGQPYEVILQSAKNQKYNIPIEPTSIPTLFYDLYRKNIEC